MSFLTSIADFFQYLGTNKQQIITLLIEHIKLTAISVVFAILIGVPLGILICYIKKLNKPILGLANVIQAIPSMALLGFAIPLLGTGTLPAVTVVVLYSLLPIIKNTYTGITNINPQTVEAAKGIGLTKLQVLTKVQIPLALPVIMAGVRISAVTAVGLMTMAAFIGAGGLGYLVFSGIRTVSNFQILAGAIPACLLALAVDYLTSLVEKIVTPLSLQKENSKSKKKQSKKSQKIILSFSAVVVLFAFIFTAVTNHISNDKIIKIGTKDYSEQMVLGHLMADMIEAHTDISVERKINLGGTNVCFRAIRSGDLDMYGEYSGTAYGDTLGYSPISDVQKVYDVSKKEYKEKFNIEVLDQMSFNNTWVMAVRKDTAQKYNLKTVSDLSKVADKLRLGGTLEFLNRDDGNIGLKKKYGMKFAKEIALDGGIRYTALVNNEVDVVDAFATDGLLKKFDLVTLEDDREFFLPYYVMPIMTNEIYKKYPEVVPLLDKLGQTLTNEVMQGLNYQVDELQIEPEVVAKKYLEENNLI